ncbi:MAG: aldo/keto reductase [Candidatus Thorarchaeota archaeon]
MALHSRKLGRSGIEVSAVGLGCWAIGGPLWYQSEEGRTPLSYGQVNDEESIRAIHRALELGLTFFDTADAYGAGHSERILGQALAGHRDDVIICTKFGGIFDESSKTWLGDPDLIQPDTIRRACESSLKRLNTDYIDIYLFHCKEYDPTLAEDLLPVMESLVNDGLVRSYGWSTPYPESVQSFVKGLHCTAIEYNYNILERNPEVLALCEKHTQASIARGPYAMGILTGKYTRSSKIPENDLRAGWDLRKGYQAKQLEMLELINEVLTRNGHTLAQAAIAWLWALGAHVIPIPGFKSVKQVEETGQVLQLGPLTTNQMSEIDKVLEPYADDLIYQD